MQLGQLKHALALECAREVLEQLWPRPFRLEQRYRYYLNTQFLEMVSRELRGAAACPGLHLRAVAHHQARSRSVCG